MNKLKLAVVGVGLMAVSAAAQAVDIRVFWTQDTTVCADGSPMATNCQLAGFQIYEGGTAATKQFKENLAATLREKFYSYAPGTTRCYSMKAFSGTISAPALSDESQTACVTVPFIPPKAPNMTVEVKLTITATLQGTPEVVK